MASIALFPCSFINGATIVGELSAQLGLTVYTDQLLLIDLAEKLGVSAEHLKRVLFGRSLAQNRIPLEKERYVNLCRSHLIDSLLSEPSKVLYYGKLAALFGPDIYSILRVLVVDSDEDRIRRAMKQEGCSPERALAMIEKNDAGLAAWTTFLHGKSPSDPSLYDLVIRYRSRDVFTVVDEIIRCYTEREATVQEGGATVALQNAAFALTVERTLLEDGYQVSWDRIKWILVDRYLPRGANGTYIACEENWKSLREGVRGAVFKGGNCGIACTWQQEPQGLG